MRKSCVPLMRIPCTLWLNHSVCGSWNWFSLYKMALDKKAKVWYNKLEY